jgi:hypothetical protein
MAAVTAAPAAIPAPAPAPVAFADTPNVLEVDDLINYSSKRGVLIYRQGCQALDNKTLTDGFSMTQSQTVLH